MHPHHKQVYQNLWHYLAFGFGTGTFPKMPGTVGTLAALPIYLLICHFSPMYYSAICLLISIFGIYLCGKVEAELNYHDYPGIVWDEITGYLIALFMLPVKLPWIMAAFILFRFLDIKKPWIIGWVNSRIKGGLGVMLDDILAGIITLIMLQIVILIINFQ